MSPLGAKYLYQQLFHFISDPVIVVDEKMAIIDCNEAATSNYGYTREEFLALNPEQIIHPDYHVLFRENMRELLSGKDVLMESVHVRKDGSSYPVEFHARDIFYNDEVCVLAVVRDISERKKAEKALRESEQNFRDLAENSPDGIIVADENAHHLYANSRAAEITGYSVEELQNITIADMTLPEELEKYKQRYQDRIEGKPVPRQYERRIVRKDGTTLLIEVMTTTTIWQRNTCGMVTIHEITEHK